RGSTPSATPSGIITTAITTCTAFCAAVTLPPSTPLSMFPRRPGRLHSALTTRARSSGITPLAPDPNTASSKSGAPTPPSTIRLPVKPRARAPSPEASTAPVRSSASTSIVATRRTASFTAAASTRRSTTPLPVTARIRGNRGTFAMGINDAGQIVGYYRDDTFNLSQTHGFLYTTTPNPAPPAPTTADMILRHDADGLYEIYDIGNNSILTAYSLAQLGTDWQF